MWVYRCHQRYIDLPVVILSTAISDGGVGACWAGTIARDASGPGTEADVLIPLMSRMKLEQGPIFNLFRGKAILPHRGYVCVDNDGQVKLPAIWLRLLKIWCSAGEPLELWAWSSVFQPIMRSRSAGDYVAIVPKLAPSGVCMWGSDVVRIWISCGLIGYADWHRTTRRTEYPGEPS